MSAVAAEQFGVRRPEGASVSDDHQLHLALVDVDEHRGASLRVHEEDDGEDGHLKLRAGPDEGAADRLHYTVPAELEVQNVVVLIRLQTETCRNTGHVGADRKEFHVSDEMVNLPSRDLWPCNLCSPGACSFLAGRTGPSCENR